MNLFFCSLSDSAFHSGSEDEEEDEHIRPPLGLSSLLNGPDSSGPLGTSDLSVQSMSTDSKTGHDDSDQVSFKELLHRKSIVIVIRKKNL